MSQANFMRNIRMTMPQFVTNVTSFGDTVKILKNKGIITENMAKANYEDPITLAKAVADAHPELQRFALEDRKMFQRAAFKYAAELMKSADLSDRVQMNLINGYADEDWPSDFISALGSALESSAVSENNDPEVETNNKDAEFDAMLKQLEDEKTGEEEVAAQYDLEEGTLTVKQIVDKFEELLDRNPNTKVDDLAKVLNTTKEELAKILGIPDLYPSKPSMNENQEPKAVDEDLQEVLTGITIEHECYPDWTYDEVQKLVKKNIKKNPQYYTNYKLTGIRDYKVQTMDSSKPEDHQMKFYTEKTSVDKAREMKKVKMPKKAVKEAMEVNPQGGLQPQGLPSAPDVDRILKFMKANKTFVSLLKNLNSVKEFTDFFRELLQLTDPELDALKVSDSQLQSIFRKAVLDKRKEDGVPNQIFKKNANIQQGINKIGGVQEAEQPQDDKIEAELSSALAQQPTLKRILQKVDLPQEVNGTIKALLDRTNLKNVPDHIILAALRKVLNDQPGPSFTAQYAANASIGKPLKEKLTALVREILAEEEIPSKKKAAEEITAKAVNAIDDHNEGEGKGYKKKWLEDVFDSYESKIGHRFDDSVFEDVIDRLKAKGYTMSMKETFDGRDNLDAENEVN